MASVDGIEFAGHVQLVERTFPLAQHAQQLKQEDAQLGIGGCRSHLVLQQLQGALGVTVAQGLFGRRGRHTAFLQRDLELSASAPNGSPAVWEPSLRRGE